MTNVQTSPVNNPLLSGQLPRRPTEDLWKPVVDEDGVAWEEPPAQPVAAPLVVEVDLSNLTIGDLGMFYDLQQAKKKGEMPVRDVLNFLDRVVVGGASQLPLTSFATVMDAVKAEMDRLAGPPGGNSPGDSSNISG